MPKIDIGHDLHALIRSLNPKERRYFKLQAQLHGPKDDKLYLRLFDFLHGQAAWSESAIRAAFPSEGFLKQLHVACTYLYRKLLATLRDYDKDKLIPLESSRRLDELSVLFERGLFAQCMRQVRLAIRYATRLELPHLELLARQWEVRLLRRQGGEQKWQQMQAAILAGRVAARAVDVENALQGLFSQLYAVNGWATRFLPEAPTSHLAVLASDPLLALDAAQLPFDAAILLHSLHSHLAVMQGDRKGYALANKNKMAVWERNKWRRDEEPERYFISLYNFVEAAIEAGMVLEVGPVIDKMERLLNRHKALALGQRSTLAQVKVRHLLNLRDFEGTRAMQAQVEAALAPVNGRTPPFFVELCANMAFAHFYGGDWLGCLHWLARAEPMTQKGARAAFNLKVGPLRLMALYEALDLEHLEQILHAWRQSPGSHPLAEVVGEAFQALAAATSQADEANALRRLIAELESLSAEPELRELVSTWADARLSGRPFKDYFR